MPRFNSDASGRFRSIMGKFRSETAAEMGGSAKSELRIDIPKFQKADDVYRHFNIPKDMPLREKVRVLRKLRSIMENNTDLIVREHAISEAKLNGSRRQADPFSEKYVNPMDRAMLGTDTAKGINKMEREMGIDPSLPSATKDRMIREAEGVEIFEGKKVVFARKVTKKRPLPRKAIERLK